jgi:hypothetical protein
MRAMASTPGLDILELGHLFSSELVAQSVHCSFWTTNNTNQTNVDVVGFKFVSFALFVVKFFGLLSLSKGRDSRPVYERTRFGMFSSLVFRSPASWSLSLFIAPFGPRITRIKRKLTLLDQDSCHSLYSWSSLLVFCLFPEDVHV